jgi:hypothetical protein
MRRSLSILMAVLLPLSMLSRAWAVDQAALKTMACHRLTSAQGLKYSGPGGQQHHCDGEAEGAAQVPAHGAPIVENHPQPCSMNCCDQTTLKSRTALISTFPFPGLIALELGTHPVSIAFISAGFSSHTDRGPPLS